ncbi:MAG: hypothetical protein HOP02_13990 [Methylococcaceae bacterium]|nr:hypothetical protein [Methylococcaceae bacterium]
MAYVVSGKFELFDASYECHLITQTVMSAAAFLDGFKKGFSQVIILFVGEYIGLNAYAYVFGSSESRSWAWLGLITTLVFVLFPALMGLLGVAVSWLLSKCRQGNA